MQTERASALIVMLMDDLLIGADLQDSLESLGHRVSKILTNGSETQQIGSDVDVVLIDLEIHEGPDVLRVGKEIAARGAAAVVYLADNDAQVERVKKEAKESGWVKWPFHPAHLDFEVRLAFEARAARLRAGALEPQPA